MSQSSARRASGRRTQRKTAKPNRLPIIILIVGIVVIMVVAGVLLSGGGSAAQQFPNPAPPGTNSHIQSPTDPHPAYNSNPPTSGWHWGGGTAPWGITTQPIPDEITVHNLEHGGVIIHYRQDLDKPTTDQLTALARELQQQNSCIIMLPRPVDKLDVPIAVTSWTWLLKLDHFDANAIRSFFNTHVGRDGPESSGKLPNGFCG